MNRCRAHAALSGLISLGMALAATSRGIAQESFFYDGGSIPAPPAQRMPWTPAKAHLPPIVVHAITELFHDGLADPRGCEYRDLVVITGSAWHGSEFATHGWVMPKQGDKIFAVCWNGVVYPVVSIGAIADLHADIAQLLAKDNAKVAAAIERTKAQSTGGTEKLELGVQASQQVAWPSRNVDEAEDECTAAATDSMLEIKVAMLMRLDETDCAERFWQQWTHKPLGAQADDPYKSLASWWAFGLYDRAVSAHMHGDDHLALASAQALIPIRNAIQAYAGTRADSDTDDEHSFLGFLKQVPDLIVDSMRRVNQPVRIPILQRADQPQGADRIAGLIQDLDLVSALQQGFPGGINLIDDASVQELVHIGNDAVTPLLTCLVDDLRLTRSMYCGHPWFHERAIIPVRQAALVALCHIVQCANFGGERDPDLSDPAQRSILAQRIRAYWERTRGLSPQEGDYSVLADDHADSSQCLEAASRIIMPITISASPGSLWPDNGSFSGELPQPGEIIPMHGESLRSKSTPSVSELLLKRMRIPTDADSAMLSDCYAFALYLADWDGKAHLKELRSFTNVMTQLLSKNHWCYNIRDLVTLYERRIGFGDPSAAGEYADLMLHRLPKLSDLGFDRLKVLEPIWRHPSNPELAAAAVTIFTDPKSAWLPLVRFKDAVNLSELFQTPLIGVEGFRAELLRGLGDTTAVGTVTVYADGHTTGGWSDQWVAPIVNDPLTPPAGTSVVYRLCDVYATDLSALAGAPPCELYWPVAKRDEAVKRCVAFLRRYGDNFRYDPTGPGDPDHVHFCKEYAYIHFPRLDHPATPEDVRACRAIFSLAGSPRLVIVPHLPFAANRLTRIESPVTESTKTGTPIIPTKTPGIIWQVEEVQTNGAWQRFYGFAAGKILAQVPAADIAFTSYRDPIVPGFTGTLAWPEPQRDATPGSPVITSYPATPTVTGCKPIAITFTVCNTTGLDLPLPAILALPTSNGTSFPSGLTLVLRYTKSFPNLQQDVNSNNGTLTWRSLPLRTRKDAHAMPASDRMLNAGQECMLSTFDLRDYFDVSMVGTYGLSMVVDPRATLPDINGSLKFTVTSR